MSRKNLKIDEIESALEDMLGLPSDPDLSEDDEESDEEIDTYNATKLQLILEDLDEPDLQSNNAIRASPQPSTSSLGPKHVKALLVPQPSTSSARLHSTYPDNTLQLCRGRGNRHGTGRGSGRVSGQNAGQASSDHNGDSTNTSESSK